MSRQSKTTAIVSKTDTKLRRRYFRNSEQDKCLCEGLRPIEITAIIARRRGKTLEETSAIVGKNVATICRWQLKPAWTQAWERLCQDWEERTTQVLREGAEAVAQTVVDNAVYNRDTPAARTVLQAVGVLRDNPAAAHTGSMAQQIAAIQLNVNVTREEEHAICSVPLSDVIDIADTVTER
jgi:hypothetical protein